MVRILTSLGAVMDGSRWSMRRSSLSFGTTPTPFINLELIGLAAKWDPQRGLAGVRNQHSGGTGRENKNFPRHVGGISAHRIARYVGLGSGRIFLHQTRRRNL